MCKYNRNILECEYICATCTLDKIDKSTSILSSFVTNNMKVSLSKFNTKYFVIREINGFEYWNLFDDCDLARNYYNKIKLIHDQPIDKLDN